MRVVRAPGSHAGEKITPKRSSVTSPTLLDLNVHVLNLVEQTDELLDVAGSDGGDDKPRVLNSW